MGLLAVLIFSGVLSAAGKNLTGKAAPEIHLKEILNARTKNTSMSDLKDRVIILEFWATWCPPCRSSIPHLNDIYRKYKGEGLVVIAVTAENESTIKSFMRDTRMSFPIGLDDNGKTNQAYGIRSIPTAYLIGKDGKVIWQGHTMSLKEEDIEAALSK